MVRAGVIGHGEISLGTSMKITSLESFLANAGGRNFLFVRLSTNTGLTGIGEATLEWQEKAVQTLLHDWVEGQVLGRDPFDIEAVVGGMIRDQYQGGATVMTAISGTEIAMWDLIGKACQQPVYQLLGGRCHANIPSYANAWFAGAKTPEDYAQRARDVVARGFRALKFDPFGVAWKELTAEEHETAVTLVARVRDAVGPDVKMMIEFHGRLSLPSAVETIREMEEFNPTWCEEPVAPESVELLAKVKNQVGSRISAGERLYTLAEFDRLLTLGAVDVVQPDITHCGGILAAKKIAAMAAVKDVQIAPHTSGGPVALAAALHFDISTPNFFIQEDFSQYDVPWRNDLVRSWNPFRKGEFFLSDEPGLGLDIDEKVIANHPYQPSPFASLWHKDWLGDFTQRSS